MSPDPSLVTGRLLLPADGEHLELTGGTTARVLEDGTRTDQRVGVLESLLPPRMAGPPQHVHREHDEMFYVVRGTVRFRTYDQVADVGEGGFFSAPIGTPHGFDNPSDEPAVLLGTFTPQRYVGYFREMRDLARRSDVDPDALRELMARYATELYRP